MPGHDRPGQHLASHWAAAPDQSERRPTDRRIGIGMRMDGPNGQSSTPQNATDSIVEIQGAGQGSVPHGTDQGWLGDESPSQEPTIVPDVGAGSSPSR